MGKGGDDGTAEYRACAACTRVCQTTHGNGLPYSVPRFHKAVPDYATPSSRNCYMQIPAGYVREHIGKGAKVSFVLEGVTGCEWEVMFNNIGLSGGWKTFATDYRLEKGDQVMFGLVAPNRFFVNVFDRFGMEKVSTSRRGSKKIAQNGNHQGSNPTSEGFHTPLQVERCGEQKPIGVDELPSTSPQHDAQVLHSNGVCADPVAAHSLEVGPCSLNRALEFDPTRALIEKLLIREPVDCDELEASGMSDSMSESEDSVQVLLAKAVLAKIRRKKLKKKKRSSIEATKSGGTEISTPLLDEGTAVNISSRNGDLANLGTDDVTENSRDDETGATELEEPTHETSCEGPRGTVNGSNGQAEPPQGAGDSNGGELQVPQNIGNGSTVEVVQDIPQPVHREDEAMAMAAAGVLNGEDSASKRGEFGNEPSAVFLAALVKEEPDLTAAGNYNETCANCGLPTIPDQCQMSTPPIPNLTCEVPETRTPSSDAPSLGRESVRATAEAAKTFSDNLATRTPSSSRPKGHGRVTEDQKQKALEAAKTFSANTKNPSAVVVMRISFVEKTCACFVSVKCAEMLPRAPTELILVDSKGYLRKANWRPERRYIQGLGWKDFVDSNSLQVNDVCVMEVIDQSSEQFQVLIHIFHAHEMDTSKSKQKEKEREQEEPKRGKEKEREKRPPVSIAEASPGARTRDQEKRSPGASQLYGLLPSKRRKRRMKSPANGAVGTELLAMPASTEVTEPGVQLTILSTEGNPGPGPSMEQQVEHESPDSTDPSQERSAGKRDRKKVRMLPPLIGPVQTRRGAKSNQFPKQYSVAKLVDRRKSLQGVVFLVELKETVTQSSSGHKRLKAKQDEKGRWWVPHSHFTSDFSSCYIE